MCLAGACSSSSKSTSSSPTTRASSPGSTVASGSGVTEAQAIVKAAEAAPTSIGVTTPVPGTIPGGKKIDFLDCGDPACHQLYQQFDQAATYLHWSVKDVNQGLSPETVTNAWNQIVANPPDAVVTSSQPVSEFQSQLAVLTQKNIPVVDCCTLNAPQGALKLVSDAQSAVDEQAKLQAAWVVANSNGSGSAVWLATPAFPALVAAQNSFQKYLAQFCSACRYSSLALAATDIGSSALPTKIVGYLRAHPSVDYVAAGFDDEFIGLPAALAQAGLSGKVKLIGSDPGATELPYIQSGQEAASVSFPAGSTMFILADALARIFVGASVAPDNIVLPRQIVTASNLASTTAPPDIPNYVSQFEKLWTVS